MPVFRVLLIAVGRFGANLMLASRFLALYRKVPLCFSQGGGSASDFPLFPVIHWLLVAAAFGCPRHHLIRRVFWCLCMLCLCGGVKTTFCACVRSALFALIFVDSVFFFVYDYMCEELREATNVV